MRRTLIVLAAVVSALIAAAPASASAASPSLVTRARHHLDRYFAEHPVHPSDGGSRSLKSCPVGSLGYAQRVLQKATGKKLPKTWQGVGYEQFNDSTDTGGEQRDQQVDCTEYLLARGGATRAQIDINVGRLYGPLAQQKWPHSTRTTKLHNGTLRYAVSKDKDSGLTSCYALWLPANASYWVNVTYSSKLVRPTWTSCKPYAKKMTTHVLRTVAAIAAK
jgi:hypothetical protein